MKKNNDNSNSDSINNLSNHYKIKTPKIKPILDVTNPSVFSLCSNESNSVISSRKNSYIFKRSKKSNFYRSTKKFQTCLFGHKDNINIFPSHIRSYSIEDLFISNNFLKNYKNDNNKKQNPIEYDSSFDYDECDINQDSHINNIVEFDKSNNNVNTNEKKGGSSKNINIELFDFNKENNSEDEEGYSLLNMLEKIKKSKKL